jgi:hypothetical protein
LTESRFGKTKFGFPIEIRSPSLAPLPQSVIGNATRHKEKAYGRVLKTRVSEVCRQTVLRGSPRVTDGSPPQGRRAAFVNYLYDDLTRNLFTPAPYLRSFSADSAYYLFRIRTQDQNIIPTQEPRPNGVPQTHHNQLHPQGPQLLILNSTMPPQNLILPCLQPHPTSYYPACTVRG